MQIVTRGNRRCSFKKVHIILLLLLPIFPWFYFPHLSVVEIDGKSKSQERRRRRRKIDIKTYCVCVFFFVKLQSHYLRVFPKFCNSSMRDEYTNDTNEYFSTELNFHQQLCFIFKSTISLSLSHFPAPIFTMYTPSFHYEHFWLQKWPFLNGRFWNPKMFIVHSPLYGIIKKMRVTI